MKLSLGDGILLMILGIVLFMGDYLFRPIANINLPWFYPVLTISVLVFIFGLAVLILNLIKKPQK